MFNAKQVEVWSCGGGTQSGAIAALIGSGKLPKPDLCFMIDTGREKSGTWLFVDGFIRPQLARVGTELAIVNKADWATVDLVNIHGTILLPGFTKQSGSVGKIDGFCSNEWKQRVGMRYLRSLGIESCRMWMGISIDEMSRVRTPVVQWVQLFYPLIFEIPMRRHRCADLIRAEGWSGAIPHSACKMCANMSDSEWIQMKTDYPQDFEDACRIEEEIREHDKDFWFHPSCVPLSEVDFTAQSTMFSDRGCTSGCFT